MTPTIPDGPAPDQHHDAALQAMMEYQRHLDALRNVSTVMGRQSFASSPVHPSADTVPPYSAQHNFFPNLSTPGSMTAQQGSAATPWQKVTTKAMDGDMWKTFQTPTKEGCSVSSGESTADSAPKMKAPKRDPKMTKVPHYQTRSATKTISVKRLSSKGTPQGRGEESDDDSEGL